MPDAAEVRARLAEIHDRIRTAGGDPGRITVLAVTKGHPPPVVEVALAAGLADLGENYAQELLAKAAWTDEHPSAFGAPRWQFIGHLQRNKVRQLAPHVALWQTIDRPELVAEVAKRAPGARVLIQVNTTGEQNKGGCPPEAAAPMVDAAVRAGLEVHGLMTVGPTDPTIDPRPGFDRVRALVDGLGLAVCSMGMTDDLEVAIRAGSTMLRIGTALFGPRGGPATVRD